MNQTQNHGKSLRSKLPDFGRGPRTRACHITSPTKIATYLACALKYRYIYVDRIDDAVRQVVAEGGEVVQPPYPEGSLWVATFRDPAGNVLGLWQAGSR